LGRYQSKNNGNCRKYLIIQSAIVVRDDDFLRIIPPFSINHILILVGADKNVDFCFMETVKFNNAMINYCGGSFDLCNSMGT